jgi:GNAT superfamily N-acetyltransferase
MKDDFVIEEVRDLDAAWPELEMLLRDSHEYYMPLVGYGPPPDWVEQTIERLRPGPEAMLVVARSSGRAVGFANALIRTAPGSPPQRFLYLDNVYVTEDSRGKGAGQAILARIESWATEQGISELRLDVFADNEMGVRFWEHVGFGLRAHSMRKLLGETP